SEVRGQKQRTRPFCPRSASCTSRRDCRPRGGLRLNTKAKPAFPTYYPYMPEASCYILPKVESAGHDKVVPPKETWISQKYGKTDEEYLASGKRDLQEMLEICQRSGVSVETLGHILEFGCAD